MLSDLRLRLRKNVMKAWNVHFGFILTNHAKELFYSYSSRFSELESNTTSDWLNHWFNQSESGLHLSSENSKDLENECSYEWLMSMYRDLRLKAYKVCEILNQSTLKIELI